MTTHIDARYAAGFVDGEGLLRIERRFIHSKHGTYVIRVHIEGADPRPLYALRRTYGGSLTYLRRRLKPTHRAMFVWVVTALAAEKFLQATMPYMIVKKEQARVLLQLRRMMRPTLKGFPRGYSDRDIAVRERLRLKLIAFKHQTFQRPSQRRRIR